MVFSEFRSRRNGSLPQTKVSSSVGGVSSSCGSVPGRRLRTERGFFHQQLTSRSRRNRCRKWPPWSRYYKRKHYSYSCCFVQTRTYNRCYLYRARSGLPAIHPRPQFPMVYYLQELCVSARASAHVRMTEGVAVPVLLHRSRDTSVQATEHEYLYMAPWGSFDEPFAACVCLISTGGTASSSLHAAF
ncbi:hypothetical protein HDV62DRAFT_65211 [Trichoderma sp. SZMC 28011]